MATVRKDHIEQIERWAVYVNNNPTKWKKIHTEFINAIFQKHEDFIKRLLESKNGKEKLKKLFPKQKF